MKKILNQYRGRLSPRQTAAGINAAAANARRLAEDAKLLLDAKRFPSAASLAILALEELGKQGILRGLTVAQSEEDVTAEWRRYRKHTEKNYMALLPDFARNGARRLRDLRSLFTSEGEAARASYDIVKQLGFYTDCCGDAHWSIPVEVIDEPLAALLTSLVTTLTPDKKPVSEMELELWQAHMRTGLNRENLLRWCGAMVAAGLKPPEYADEMRRFTENLETTEFFDSAPLV